MKRPPSLGRRPRPAGHGAVKGEDGVPRCWWCAGDPLYVAYHDGEWGLPSTDNLHIFEHVCLEGFQAGLSWITVLRKREAFREAFAGFDPEAVARFNARSVERLLRNDGIIRHRGKIESAVNNARRAIELIEEAGSLTAFFWRYEPPRRRAAVTRGTIPATSPESVALSKDLKRMGWTFVGPTTMYAHMQAIGMVNDHVAACASRSRVEAARRSLRPPAFL